MNSISGGVFNHTTDITFTTTGDKVKIQSNFMGLDVFGQLKLEVEIMGSVPKLPSTARVDFIDYDEVYTKSSPGTIRAHQTRTNKLISGNSDYPFTQDQLIVYQECPYMPFKSQGESARFKFSRGVVNYEATEGIVRFAVNTKVAPLEEEDPCVQGRASCGQHSSCVVEGDEFRCICNPGYDFCIFFFNVEPSVCNNLTN